jgi:protein SCO1
MPGKTIRKRIILGLAALLSVAIITVGIVSLFRSAPALPVIAQLEPFSLTNSQGEPFRTDALRGKVWVANFIFTSCQGICPILSSKMARLHSTFADPSRVGFVSISVDPETDTPEALTQYALRFQADTTRWHFLTGDAEAIKEIMVGGFLLPFADQPIFHSERFVLIDAAGQIRGYYNIDDKAAMASLPSHIAQLINDRS